jgi:hypothetical protein
MVQVMNMSRMLRIKSPRTSRRGSGLMEYAVPMAVILVMAGVLTTALDLRQTLGQYFMAGSGHTQSSLSNGNFKVEALASTATGATSDGSRGFTSFGSITDGSGTVSAPAQAASQTGSRAAETLFPP